MKQLLSILAYSILSIKAIILHKKERTKISFKNNENWYYPYVSFYKDFEIKKMSELEKSELFITSYCRGNTVMCGICKEDAFNGKNFDGNSLSIANTPSVFAFSNKQNAIKIFMNNKKLWSMYLL